MTILTSQTTFTIAAPPEVFTEVVDLVLLPENDGVNALRELRYPYDALPPLIYAAMPSKWENFDTVPLTAQPSLQAIQTLGGTVLNEWPGFREDLPVREYWAGSESGGVMSAYFFRRLAEYFFNRPADGSYIAWYPKDRTTQGYYIKIESLNAGGKEVLNFNYPHICRGVMAVEVALTFRIVGEVT